MGQERQRPPRSGRAWVFYPAPWLLAAPVVVVAGVLGWWPLAVAAATGALLVMRSLIRRDQQRHAK